MNVDNLKKLTSVCGIENKIKRGVSIIDTYEFLVYTSISRETCSTK